MASSEDINARLQRLLELSNLLDQQERSEPYLQLRKRTQVTELLDMRRRQIEKEAKQKLSLARKQIHSITLFSANFPKQAQSTESINSKEYSGNNPVLKELFAKLNKNPSDQK
ncbi:hypothetical protein [Ewingella americana]|uniref:Uncharacterized protein n=1 Tax=Ewingella americana TaxID=41202 RepID=A0A502GDU6_9GAMM|nr:hypothetical protein [Ewingella americana]TPG60085.1 hypothetical protein EAH77_16080 [Ewingella americana]